MKMDGFMAMTVICIIFAIGDVISTKTKAVCSTMFVSAVLLLVGFQTGILPKDIFNVSMLLPVGGILIAFLITHMGTLMNIQELIEQWKTVIIGVCSMIGICLVLYFIGPIFIDRVYAIAAAPSIAGGVVAAIVMGEAGDALGLTDIAVYGALIVAVQGLLGFPIASFCLRKEAIVIRKKFAECGHGVQNAAIAQKEKKYLIPQLPESLRGSSNILMAKLGIATVFAIWLAGLTNGVVHRLVVCLIVGILLKEIGFLEDNIMMKANAFGYAMISILVVIFANLATASSEMLISLAFPLVIAFVLGTVGILVASVIAGKLLKISPYMAISIGVSTMVGFPGTYIISNEVARSMGETDEERKFILDNILPKMLVAGFVTVTVGSVIVAGIMVNFIK